MDPVILGGAATGLVMGSFAYVLVRFWARPVIAYRRLKKRLAGLLPTTVKAKSLSKSERDGLRRIALELQDLTDQVLPDWYKLALQRRDEHPREAVRHLQTLANCREPEAVRRRIAAVRHHLLLPVEGGDG